MFNYLAQCFFPKDNPRKTTNFPKQLVSGEIWNMCRREKKARYSHDLNVWQFRWSGRNSNDIDIRKLSIAASSIYMRKALDYTVS